MTAARHCPPAEPEMGRTTTTEKASNTTAPTSPAAKHRPAERSLKDAFGPGRRRQGHALSLTRPPSQPEHQSPAGNCSPGIAAQVAARNRLKTHIDTGRSFRDGQSNAGKTAAELTT